MASGRNRVQFDLKEIGLLDVAISVCAWSDFFREKSTVYQKFPYICNAKVYSWVRDCPIYRAFFMPVTYLAVAFPIIFRLARDVDFSEWEMAAAFFLPKAKVYIMGIDFFWLIVAVAAAYTVRGLYRRIRYAHLLRRRRRTTSDRPVAVLYYVSQPLRY